MKSEWKRVTIESVCHGIYDGPHATPPPSDNGAIFLGISNFANGRLNFSDIRYIAEEDMPKWTKRVTPQAHDIVFSYEATLNLYAIIPEGFHGCLGRRMALMRPDESKIDYRYLFYYMYSSAWRGEIEKHKVNGSTVDRIPLVQFPSFVIELPDMITQHRIADILSALDDKIELNHQINDNLQQQAQAIFRSRFLTRESLPDGWTKATLGDVSLMGAGGDKPKTVSATQTEDCPYPVYSNGISNEGLYGFSNEYKIKDESITVSARGTIGFVCLRHLPYTPIVRLVTLIPKNDVLSAKYLYLWLRNTHIHGTGTTQQQLTVPDFCKTEIILPTKGEMTSFTDVVTPLFEAMWANQAENAKLANVRDTLLPKLMSGEIDVSAIQL